MQCRYLLYITPILGRTPSDTASPILHRRVDLWRETCSLAWFIDLAAMACGIFPGGSTSTPLTYWATYAAYELPPASRYQ